MGAKGQRPADYTNIDEAKQLLADAGYPDGFDIDMPVCDLDMEGVLLTDLAQKVKDDLSQIGINVNIVCPLAWTAQLENFEKQYPDAFKANVKMPPAGHYGDVEKEIGRACVQLASPDFKYMNGETITLEGGMGQRP